MTRHHFSATAAALMSAITFSAALAAENPSPSWDGLIAVESKRLDAVYLMPGADFRTYTKVMFDPVEVALKKDWLRDYNRTAGDLSGQISNADVQKAFATIRTTFSDIFAKAYSAAGYQVVTMPGPDVLRVRTGVMNLSVTAPDTRSGSSRSYSREAGEATLVLEARDSESGALMGRAVDRRLAGDTSRLMRNSVTNRSDFSRLGSAPTLTGDATQCACYRDARMSVWVKTVRAAQEALPACVRETACVRWRAPRGRR